jgi:hypothetical protein
MTGKRRRHFLAGIVHPAYGVVIPKKYRQIPGDQEGLFKLALQLRKFFNSVIYNSATGYVLLVYLTNI